MSDKDLHDLIVLNDLHLGEGLLPREGRYSPTEDFFLDKPFARFIDHLIAKYKNDPSKLVLVLNGDIWDFLTVTRVPSDEEAAARGFTVSSSEKKFGLNPSEAKSIFKIETIFQGHRQWFHALSRFIAAGFRVEIIPGNHDIEIYYLGVRQRILELLASFKGGANGSQVQAQVRFHRWFYLEPGRIFVEHGHQYDESNSLTYPLRPLLSKKRFWQRKDTTEELIDYPLGSSFVRYFYNRVRSLDPYTPRLLTFDQYLDFVKRYNLFDVWRIYKDHYPHFVAALGPDTALGLGGETKEADEAQQAELDKLENESEHGYIYKHLSALKIHPMSANTAALVKEMVEPVVKRIFWLSVFAVVALLLWIMVFMFIQKIPWVVLQVPLMTIFAVVTVGLLAWSWIHFRRRQQRRRLSKREDFTLERAEKVAHITKTPIVVMGHTHMVDIQNLNNGSAVYVNGGTWTSVHNPWNRIMRDARRKTFAMIKGNGAELARWNDDANRIDEVPLFYLEQAHTWDFAEKDLLPPADIAPEHSWLPSAQAVTPSDDKDPAAE